MVLAARSTQVRQLLETTDGSVRAVEIRGFSDKCVELVLCFCYGEQLDAVLRARPDAEQLGREFLAACRALGLLGDDDDPSQLEEGEWAERERQLRYHKRCLKRHPKRGYDTCPLFGVELELSAGGDFHHAGLLVQVRRDQDSDQARVTIRRRLLRSLRPMLVEVRTSSAHGILPGAFQVQCERALKPGLEGKIVESIEGLETPSCETLAIALLFVTLAFRLIWACGHTYLT